MQIDVPRVVETMLTSPTVESAARFALASPFVVSGIAKLLDFNGTSNEIAALGLRPPLFLAMLVILTQLAGSVLFLTRQYCWLGAGILSVFTIIATLLAHRFWAFSGIDFVRQMTTFFEHAAIVGGLAAAAIYTHRLTQ